MRALAAILLTLFVAAVGAAADSAPSAARAGSGSGWDLHSLRSLVYEVSEQHGLDPDLVDALVRVESGYDPRAVSRRGAMGLMQLMPHTARRLRVSNPFDPEQNVRAGVREFSRLIDRYAGNVLLALAAYNAGEGAVQEHRGIPPFAETRGYVRRIMTLYTGRPYEFRTAQVRAPVRMVRDPHSGEMVITNVGRGAGSGTQTGLTGGALRGGFGTSR